jgi:hypothetical protein
MATKIKVVRITSSYNPNRTEKPYVLGTIDDDARRPRVRYFESYVALIQSVEKVNPGCEIVEA